MAKILEIRNSTAEFLTFLAANQEGELMQDRTTQKIGVVQQEGSRSVNRKTNVIPPSAKRHGVSA